MTVAEPKRPDLARELIARAQASTAHRAKHVRNPLDAVQLGQSRHAAYANTNVLRRILAEHDWLGHRLVGPAARVYGIGSSTDSARYRLALAAHHQVPATAVRGWVVDVPSEYVRAQLSARPRRINAGIGRTRCGTAVAVLGALCKTLSVSDDTKVLSVNYDGVWLGIPLQFSAGRPTVTLSALQSEVDPLLIRFSPHLKGFVRALESGSGSAAGVDPLLIRFSPHLKGFVRALESGSGSAAGVDHARRLGRLPPPHGYLESRVHLVMVAESAQELLARIAAEGATAGPRPHVWWPPGVRAPVNPPKPAGPVTVRKRMSEHRRPTQLRRRAPGSVALTQSSLRGLVLRPMLGAGVAVVVAGAAHQAGQLPLPVAASSAAAVWIGMTFHGLRRADAALAGANVHLENVVSGLEELRTAVSETLEQVETGTLNSAPATAPSQFSGSLSADPVLAVEQLLFVVQGEVEQAIASAAQLQQHNVLGERAQTDLLRTIAQRQSALIARALEALDKAESSVEDPDILDSFFRIDHLVTQLRRSAENIAVLGGQPLAGRSRTPLPVSTALRRSVEEIERYDRIQITPPPDKLAFPGHVGPDLVHLLAELLENAVRFSDSRTRVVLTATEEQGGLVIAIRDQGISMQLAQMVQLNAQLDAPETVDVYARLRTGAIGLVVTGQLARRCGIRVQLRANHDGPGLTAFVLIPNSVLTTASVPQVRSAPAPARVATSYRERLEPLAHHGDYGPPRPAGASHPSPVGAAPAARQHTAVAPTEGRIPLPVRPAQATPHHGSAHTAAAPVTSKGPTPGLVATYRQGVQRAAQHRPDGE
ncbi:ATP-binding protein [Streptomyces sp. NPDC048392]|uniref:ATP-binding protein n=1 Tax=Streptomyces sp. NPDC048392 TaxID=3365543 RepID=UPI003720ED3B